MSQFKDQTPVQKAVSILNSKSTFNAGFAGKLTNVKVTHVGNHVDENGRSKVIINFALMSDYQRLQADALMEEGKFEDAQDKGLSTDYLLPTTKFVPVAGEFVDLQIKQEDSNNFDGTFAKVMSILPIKGVEATKVDYSRFLDAKVTEQEETLDEVIGKKK